MGGVMERHLLVFAMTTLAVVGRWVLDPWLADSAQYTLLYFVVAFAAAVAGGRASLRCSSEAPPLFT